MDKTGEKYQKSFENASAVDFSELLCIYQQEKEAMLKDSAFDLTEALLGKTQEEVEGALLYADTTFAIYLPEYADSEHPFLAGAESFYNSCLFAFNLWSNQEVWVRSCDGRGIMVDEKEVKAAMKAISPMCIRHDIIREAAQSYQDSLIGRMDHSAGKRDEEECSMDILLKFSDAIQSQSYCFYQDEEAFVDSLNEMTTELAEATRQTFELYKQADEEEQPEIMLHSLNDCRSFDEQCSLFLNWADCKESEDEDEWIIAVADKLMESKRYNPCLNNIWQIWRCLFQTQYCGMSRDSAIPNDLYNSMRRLCYQTCLKRIEEHPDDIFAMNCAAALAGRTNINRFGQNPFGNEASTERRYSLPNRF